MKITTLPAAGTLRDNGVAVTAGQSIPRRGPRLRTASRSAGAPNANGTAYATFTFQVQDDGGTANGGVDLDPTPNTITVDVTAVNDDPSRSQTARPSPRTPPQRRSTSSRTTPMSKVGRARSPQRANGAKGTVTFTDTGVTYKPNLHVNGADSFTYTISDNQGGTATGTVNVTITPVNHNPLALNDAGLTVPEGAGATALNVLGNDSDADGDTLAITAPRLRAHGTVAITGWRHGSHVQAGDPLQGHRHLQLHGQRRPRRDGSGHGPADVTKDTTDARRDRPGRALPGPDRRHEHHDRDPRLDQLGSGSGVVSYQLQVSVDGGTFTTISLPSPTATSITRTQTDGHTYAYRVRATDFEGNTSGYQTGPTLKPARFQENNAAVHYAGSWTTTTSGSLSGGHGKTTSSTYRPGLAHDRVRDVAWVATKTTTSGSAQVWIDGSSSSTINLRSTTTHLQPARLPPRLHEPRDAHHRAPLDRRRPRSTSTPSPSCADRLAGPRRPSSLCYTAAAVSGRP